MELWLLVGAVVLIALTVWIVWPAQRSEETTTMTDSSLPPQGSSFQDQYTSATADLSAGGVATARETTTPGSMSAPMPERASGSEPWASPTVAREGIERPMLPEPASRNRGLVGPRTMGTGAAVVLMVSGGVGGAWLFQRWQHERNRPINRLRRGARDLTQHLPEYLDELPDNSGRIGGAAAALLVSSLLVSRARGRSSESEADAARDMIRDAVEQGRERARRLSMPDIRRPDLKRPDFKRPDFKRPELRRPDFKRPEIRRPELRRPEKREAIFGGLGLGGTAIVVGAVWLIWKLLRGNDQSPHHLYITDRMGE